ncbi:MAG TPA: ATP-binding protein, partial [Pyrinomonadaceae bacterium]|nr:ATP-binding protein [Pyrinomonadaceae bacterium]
NLLSNAIKFTGAGGHVRVHLARVNSHIEIIFRDTGQGIGADFLPHVFDRFRQADGTTTRTHGGLGLGLAIVRHLVELHGGTIKASSAGDGQGATFTVQLPVLKSVGANEASDAKGALVSEEGNGASASPAGLEGLRVLVVDDEEDTRDLIATVLARCGAEVKAVANVPDALAAFGRWKPDLLISDIGIPHEDGYSLIKKVRAQESAQRNRIPAIALTAYANIEDRLRSLSAGFQMHVAKPLEPSELIAVVATLAGRIAKV